MINARNRHLGHGLSLNLLLISWIAYVPLYLMCAVCYDILVRLVCRKGRSVVSIGTYGVVLCISLILLRSCKPETLFFIDSIVLGTDSAAIKSLKAHQRTLPRFRNTPWGW